MKIKKIKKTKKKNSILLNKVYKKFLQKIFSNKKIMKKFNLKLILYQLLILKEFN